MIYGLFSGVLLMGIGALAVDWGRVTVAKSELKTASDAAVRAGGMKLLEYGSTQEILFAARDTVEKNTVDGSQITANGETVQLGVYVPETGNFYLTNDSKIANALRVTLIHKFDDSNMPLFFSRFLTGQDQSVSTSSIVMVTDVPEKFVASQYTVTVAGNKGSTPATSTPQTASTKSKPSPTPTLPPTPKPSTADKQLAGDTGLTPPAVVKPSSPAPPVLVQPQPQPQPKPKPQPKPQPKPKPEPKPEPKPKPKPQPSPDDDAKKGTNTPGSSWETSGTTTTVITSAPPPANTRRLVQIK